MDAASRELERRTKAFALQMLAFVAGFRKPVVSELKESSELLAIFTSIGKTAKSRYRRPRLGNPSGSLGNL